jgi:hypothetical protein
MTRDRCPKRGSKETSVTYGPLQGGHTESPYDGQGDTAGADDFLS